MAKKVAATIRQKGGHSYSKVIKMIKSPETGAYIFKEEMVPNEKVKEYFNK